MAEIRIENLQKKFGNFVAVKESSMTVKNGEFFCLLGPSGCGKTTTLRMIAGLEIPSSGRILLDREEVTFLRAAKRDIAFVFQLFALYPHMNVRQNISFPLRSEGMARKQIKTRIQEVADLLQIGHLLNKPVSGLAGGDRQRVALGRAIVRRPKAFLMDEPLGTLDAEFRALMCQELRGLHDRIDATTVYVTHDQVEAMTMAHKIAVMNHGVVEQVGTPDEIYNKPRTKFVAGFVGSPEMNFLESKGPIAPGAVSVPINGGEIAVPRLHEGVEHKDIVLGARPEHIYLSDEAKLRGEVFVVEYLGARQMVTVDTSAGRVRVRVPISEKVTIGDRVGLGFRSQSLMVFDNKTDQTLQSDLLREADHG